MNYQIRHSEFGIFLGTMMGMAFWYPVDRPELEYQKLPICAFKTKKDAQTFITFLNNKSPEPQIYRGKITIEPFDEELNLKLIAEAQAEEELYKRNKELERQNQLKRDRHMAMCARTTMEC